ncbi:MAG: tetratricopeptide repeat protein, partial [Myxococcales bacterium]|nr:tetratricopeptide repeat protein [Myxococcales bacterium]
RTPWLVVLDYAETDPASAAALLREMIKRRTGPHMRVVMLAREDGPWLRQIRDDDDRVAELLERCGVHELRDLYTAEEARERGYAAARASFAASGAGASVPSSEAVDEPLTLGRELRDRALYVHMQALLATYGDVDAAAGRLSPAQILEGVLKHERRFWTRTIEGMHKEKRRLTELVQDGAMRVAAALVLCGGVETPEAAMALSRAVASYLGEDDLRTIVECFTEIYAGPRKGSIAPLEPDLLGETLVAQMLREESGSEGLQRWLELPFEKVAPKGAMMRALTVLARLASRSIGREWLEWVLRERGAVLKRAVRTLKDSELAEVIGNVLPSSTVESLEIAATAYDIALRVARSKASIDAARMARLLAQLGRTQNDLGRREEALRAMLDAAEVYRSLAQQQPEIFRPDLAISLNTVGSYLSDLGRQEEALKATQEAVDLFTELAEQSDEFRLGLASALNNLSADLNALGRREEALGLALNVVEIRRWLARQRADKFLADLAGALNNLGIMQSSLGRREEALRA